MNKKTLLAGKVFQLTYDQSNQFDSEYSMSQAPEYIMFESILIGDSLTFCLFSLNFELLLVDSIIKKESLKIGMNEMFSDAEPVNDFYKKKVKSKTKKGKSHMGLSTFVKKLMDKDLKAMHDLGYVGGDLALTSEGTDWLLAELFLANKAELGKAARAELAEKKKKKSKKK